MRPRHAAFTFTHRDLAGSTVRLGYRLHGGPSPDVDLEETLALPEGLAAGTGAIDEALLALHLAAGVSYWKTSCPQRIEIESGALTGEDAAFFGALYENGLGEMFHRNGMAPQRAPFPGGAAAAPSPAAARTGGPPLVLIGGGKDSAVSIELLRAAGESPTLLAVGRHPWILRAAEASGLPLRVVERRLSPKLFELNEQGALNGHVPVTAIIELIGQLVALLGGFGAVVASNERSASEGSVVASGAEVNHQWSKGLAFERSLRAWSERHLGGSPAMFSLLRPFGELAIAREFARHPRWFGSVTSCNANFAIAPRQPAPRWCGRCPKCVFVFAIVTPWLDDAGRSELFGADFLADEANVPVAEELLGLARHKPFECVGTSDEMRAALWLCHSRGLHAATPVMRRFRDRVLPLLPDGDALVAACLAPSSEHLVPARFLPALAAASAA